MDIVNNWQYFLSEKANVEMNNHGVLAICYLVKETIERVTEHKAILADETERCYETCFKICETWIKALRESWKDDSFGHKELCAFYNQRLRTSGTLRFLTQEEIKKEDNWKPPF